MKILIILYSNNDCVLIESQSLYGARDSSSESKTTTTTERPSIHNRLNPHHRTTNPTTPAVPKFTVVPRTEFNRPDICMDPKIDAAFSNKDKITVFKGIIRIYSI